ncbi:hypothetical protein ACFSHR_10065 [Azotobacter chroococcum]
MSSELAARGLLDGDDGRVPSAAPQLLFELAGLAAGGRGGGHGTSLARATDLGLGRNGVVALADGCLLGLLGLQKMLKRFDVGLGS